MASGKGLRQVGYVDCPGGGQVIVRDGIAYVGHMRSPHGTSIIDVSDPARCREIASLPMPSGTHSHKVRVAGDVMLVNHEINGADPGPVPENFRGGLGIYDISNPAKPRLITNWETQGKGVHRFDFDGRYVYLSATVEGYVGTIVLIMDLAEPGRPEEVGRWWIPGQWIAGGEQPSWSGTDHRCHHPLRMGDRLYTSYWLAGFVILDIGDMTKPSLISSLDWSPPFVCPTHTALPIPFEIRGRNYIVVADEDVIREPSDPAAFMWVVDVTDERNIVPVGSFQVEGIEGREQPRMTACHQPCEIVTGTEIPFAWFANGLRIIDVKNPHSPAEVACFVPDVPEGCDRVSSNDVTIDDRGLIYLIDRQRGLTIVERT